MQTTLYLSHLFMLRLWKEQRTGQGEGVRIRVKHVLSGEVRYFREWPALIEYLMYVMEDGMNDVDDCQD